MKTKSPPKEITKEVYVGTRISRSAFNLFKTKAEINGQTIASRLRLILEADPKRNP